MKRKLLSRHLIPAFILATIMGYVSTPASAQDEEEPAGAFSFNLALTSDYRFRGQSQSGPNPAVQGGIDYEHDSGLFAGIWASSIDFDDPQESPAEVDLYVGYWHGFSDATEGTLTAYYYWYPDSAPANYSQFEFIGTLSHDLEVFSLNGELAYSPDYSGSTGNAVSVMAGADIPVALGNIDWLTASAHVGKQWIDDNYNYGTPDWVYYDVGLSANWGIFSLYAGYTGTDTSEADCWEGTTLCRGGVVATLGIVVPFN